MWGTAPAFLALVLIVFDPNLIAHGALVTTDMGVTLGIFLAVFAFYWFVKRPSAVRLILAGLAAGVALTAKHSGILIFPILAFLAILELKLNRSGAGEPSLSPERLQKRALTLIASLAAIAAIAVVVLWSAYGFRFAARPAGMTVSPTLAVTASSNSPAGSQLLLHLADWKLLPESYLYGLADINKMETTPTYLFGKYYPRAQWFYFPAIFAVKSTFAFLLLCLLAVFAPLVRCREHRREMLFLVVPAVVYFAVAMGSGINYGVRHILPVYPFLIVLAAAGAWSFFRAHRALAAVVAVLLMAHVASSLRAFPDHLAYSNELWGGPANSYRIVADSNVDWGQGLKAMKQYLDQRGIHDCWFAYFGANVADSSYYGIPCRPLPNSFSRLTHAPMPAIPATVDGPIFLSASEVAGTLWGGEAYNPYVAFRDKPPSALIAHSILVYEGRFELAAAAAIAHEMAAAQHAGTGQLEQAMAEAQAALAIAPNAAGAHAARARVLAGLSRFQEAREEYQTVYAIEEAANAGN
jgi:hypothetical protein